MRGSGYQHGHVIFCADPRLYVPSCFPEPSISKRRGAAYPIRLACFKLFSQLSTLADCFESVLQRSKMLSEKQARWLGIESDDGREKKLAKPYFFIDSGPHAKRFGQFPGPMYLWTQSMYVARYGKINGEKQMHLFLIMWKMKSTRLCGRNHGWNTYLRSQEGIIAPPLFIAACP